MVEGDLVSAAGDALAAGDVAAAMDLLERSLRLEERPEVRLLLGRLRYADDHLESAREQWELAFRAARAAGDLCRAARTATLLADLHAGALGNEATGRGWLERARRLLEQVGPCVE